MKRITFSAVCILLIFTTLFGQNTNKFNPNNLTLGGNLGLQFGDYTSISIAPQIGYTFNQYLNAGAGISYSYYKYSFYSGRDKYKNTSSYFGMNIYAKFYPTNLLVIMVQPEANRMWSSLKSENSSDKYTESKFVPSVLVGAGLRLGPITAMLQYDIVQDVNSPYGDKIFYNIGYTWSF